MTSGQRESILLIGTDRYVMNACRESEVDVVVARGPAAHDNGFVRVPDGFVDLLVEDQRNPEAILGALHRAGLRDRRFAAVQTSWEYSLVTAGTVAAVLGARAIPPDVAVAFRDKFVQKQMIAAAGLPVTRTRLIPDIRAAEQATELPFPAAVVKPVAGAATAMTAAVRSAAELRAFAASCRGRSAARVFLMEEFVDGAEYVADGVMVGGRLRFLTLGRYAEPCLSVLEGTRPLRLYRLDPDRDAAVYAEAEPLVSNAVSVLGLRDGVFHMELFADATTGRLSFSECGARRGGALVHEEVFAKFGIDLGAAAVQCALGREPMLRPRVIPDAVGGVYLQGPPGVLLDAPAPADVRERPGVLFARVEKPIGTVLSTVGDTDQRIGQALVSGSSPEEMLERMDAVADWFEQRVVVAPSGATPSELRAWQRRSRPDRDYADELIVDRLRASSPTSKEMQDAII